MKFAAALLLATIAFGGGTLQLPDGPGKKILESACATCHGLDVVASKKFSKQRWQVIVIGMLETNSLKKAEMAELVDYLAANFGEKDRGRELVESICSVCHEWQRVEGRHLSKDEWAGTIKGMIFEGAPVTDEEFELMVNYLARAFGRTKE